MLLKNRLVQFLILFIIALINHHWIFSHEQYYDTIIFWSVKNLPEVNTLKYFYHIFTSFSGHSGQYRPLGFFGYFYIFGNIFNNNFFYYSFLSIFIFSSTAFQLKKWIKNNFQKKSLSWFASILYIFSPATVYLVYDTSCGGKYLLTTFIFIFQLNYVDKNIINKITFRNGVILFLLNLFAFLLHEGCIVFPITVLIYLIFKKKQITWYYIISFIHVFIYLLIRFVINDPPPSGMMHLGTSMLWKNFSAIQGMIWNPLLIRYKVGYLGILIALAVSLIILFKKNIKEPLVYLCMNLILICPFIFLDNHLLNNIIFKGGSWALITTIFFVTYLLNNLNLTKRPIHSYIILISILCFVNFFFHGTKRLIEPYIAKAEVMQNKYLKRIKNKIADSNEEYIRITGSSPKIFQKPNINSALSIYQSEFIPGLLLKYFPDKKFILTNSARFENGLELETLVQNGYYLYIKSKETDKLYTFDRFNFQSLQNFNFVTNLEIFDYPEIVINQ